MDDMVGIQHYIFIFSILIILGVQPSSAFPPRPGDGYTCDCSDLDFRRSDFRPGFKFGAAAAAYQMEGAWNVSGRGTSMWDSFAHSYPDRIADHSNGDVATNSYYMYKEDVRTAKLLNLDVYRISISWPRLLPNGKLSGGINPDGVRYYNDLISEIVSQGLEPCVTIFHWDVPQYLEDIYGGFLSPRIVEDFVDFADTVFRLFGDRVKTWITLNEPNTFSINGYAVGSFAPGRCSFWYDGNCTGGDAGTEPYIVTHNLLLAHAATVRLYRTKYQAKQKGRIGITLAAMWFLRYNPLLMTDAPAVALDFTFGWFMDPVTYGEYPESMRGRVGQRLPTFTYQQKNLLRKSYDFLGLNYYTSLYARPFPSGFHPPYKSYVTDGVDHPMQDIHGNYVGGGPMYDHNWIQLYPIGLHRLLLYIKRKYGDPTIFITENGMCTDASVSTHETLNDTLRVTYLAEHVCCVKKAIEKGANVEGMIFWSLIDNFEWASGYTQNYGLYFVDYDKGYKRVPKYSALWLSNRLSDHQSHSPNKELSHNTIGKEAL